MIVQVSLGPLAAGPRFSDKLELNHNKRTPIRVERLSSHHHVIRTVRVVVLDCQARPAVFQRPATDRWQQPHSCHSGRAAVHLRILAHAP